MKVHALYVWLCLAVLHSALAGWEQLHSGATLSAPTGEVPGMRYSHAYATFGDKWVLSHGYFYDRAKDSAVWLKSTWTLDMSAKEWTARRRPNTRSLSSGDKKKDTVPCARYGAPAVSYGNTFYMWGGTDGGFNATGTDNYVPGFEFADLWALDVTSGAWRLEFDSLRLEEGPPRSNNGGLAATGEWLLIWGGHKNSIDVWGWHTRQRKLVRIQLHDSSDDVPGARSGMVMRGLKAQDAGELGFVLYGGRDYETRMSADDAVWLFVLGQADTLQPTGAWRQLYGHTDSDGHTDGPLPLLYAAGENLDLPAVHASYAGRNPAFLVSGGSTSSPAMLCRHETWVLVLAGCPLATYRWQRLDKGDLPWGHYHASIGVHKGSAFMYGGHFCSASKGDMPEYYSDRLLELDLKAALPTDLTRNLEPACGIEPASSWMGDEL